MAITASMVKELRDKTGAGMMDCKTALSETDGNMEEAVEAEPVAEEAPAAEAEAPAAEAPAAEAPAENATPAA